MNPAQRRSAEDRRSTLELPEIFGHFNLVEERSTPLCHAVAHALQPLTGTFMQLCALLALYYRAVGLPRCRVNHQSDVTGRYFPLLFRVNPFNKVIWHVS